MYVRSVLDGLGYPRTTTTDNGKDALELLKKKQPDVVITDLDMSPMSGIELVRRIRHRESEVNQKIPIIVLSGHGNPKAVKLALKAGANQFLVKPVHPQKLQQRIAKVLDDSIDYRLEGDYFVAYSVTKEKSEPLENNDALDDGEVWELD